MLERAVTDELVGTVLIAGEAGIGKTRLVGEFTRRLGADGLVLAGRCPDLGTAGVAFAPFIAALRSLLRQRGAGSLLSLLPPEPALGRWLPELAAPAPAYGHDLVPGEIVTLLERLAASAPTVLVLEDMHWADDASRELFGFLVANLVASRLLLVATYRPADAGPLRGLVAELRRAGGVLMIEPSPLTRHEVGRQLAALIGREPDPGLITRVFERSGGNPLFVEALSQSPSRLPAGITELLLSFQDRLTPEARGVSQVAAVIGSPVPHDLLVQAADLPRGTLHTAVRELVGRELLLTADAGYEFRHVLIRQAIYDDLLPAERTDLHQRLAELLRTRPDLVPPGRGSAELAYHAAAAGEHVLALTASWDAAADGGLSHLDRVLELWDVVPQAADLLGVTRLTVLEQVVDACVQARAAERGIEAAGAALAIVDPGAEPSRAAYLLRQRAYLLGQTGAGPGEDLRHALRLLPADQPALDRGEILAELALTRVFGGDAAGAADDAAAAASIAGQLGASALAARAYACLALASADQAGVAAGYFGWARAAADDPRTLLDVITWESAVLVAAGYYDKAIAAVQEGLRIAHETFRFAESAPVLLVKWVQALTATGRWTDALQAIEDALADPLPPLSQAALLLCRAKIALAQGNTATASAMAELTARLLGDGQWALPYRLQLAAVRCELALDPVERARILAQTVSDHASMLAAHPHETWPLAALAAQVPGGPVQLGGQLPAPSAVDLAYRAVYLAAIETKASRWDDAARAWCALRQPYEQARCHLAAAEAHAAEGDRTAAGDALRSAAAIAAELGAVPLAGAVGHLARRAGLSISQASSGGDSGQITRFGLTAREQEVLRLIARGRSNRQIAEELFISVNTAGVHVSRILAKLGAASRTEATAIAHKHQLLANNPPEGDQTAPGGPLVSAIRQVPITQHTLTAPLPRIPPPRGPTVA